MLNCFTTAFTQVCSAIRPFGHKSVNNVVDCENAHVICDMIKCYSAQSY